MRETSRDVTSSTMRGEEGMVGVDMRGVTGSRRVVGDGDLGEVEDLVEVEVVEVVTVCTTRVRGDSEEETEASLPRGEAEDTRCLHPRSGCEEAGVGRMTEVSVEDMMTTRGTTMTDLRHPVTMTGLRGNPRMRILRDSSQP